MNIKKYLVAIFLGTIASLFNLGESLALDEWNNKVKMETSVNLPEIKRKIEIVVSHEEIYDFKIDKWSAYKYALELGT